MNFSLTDRPAYAGAARGAACVLIAHAPSDQSFCAALVKHLATMEGQGLIHVWHAGLIRPGAAADADKRAELERADVLLFLVSADLVASEEGWKDSLGRAIERHEAGEAIVVPIPVRAVDLSGHLLASLGPLPASGEPIAQREDQDAAWAEVAAGLRRLLEARPAAGSAGYADRDGARPGEMSARVARIARLRHPDSDVVEHRAPDPFERLVLVVDGSGRAEEVEPIGVLDGPISDAALQAFAAKVEAPYRRDNPLLKARIVHTGAPADDDLFRHARRCGVMLETIEEYEKIVRFDRYLDWQARGIDVDPLYPDHLYIPQRAEVRIRLDQLEAESALDAITQLMSDPHPRLVLVLGDFGTGKTFLMRQLCRRLTMGGGAPPVLVEMRNLEKSLGLDSLLAQHFQLAGAGAIRVDAFRYLLSEGKAVLLFDGFDELAFRVSYDRVMEHFQTVLEAARGKAKVVITSRTAHFLNDRGVELELARRASCAEGYRLVKLHPFDERQIRGALVKRLGSEAEAERRMHLLRQIEDLMGLSQNPRMLGFILQIPTEALEEARNKSGKITSAGLYELLVTRWLEGEMQRTKEGRSALPLDLPMLWRAVTELALLLWKRTEKGIAQKDIPDILWESLRSLDPSRTVDAAEAKATLGSRSLLIRSDEGRFSFMHDSILDWLVARAVAADVRDRADAPVLGHQTMNDLMTDFLVILAGREPVTRWARSAMAGSSDIARANAGRALRRLRAEGDEEADIRVVLDLSGHDLRGQDFSGADQLHGAILEGADLGGATLVGANLAGARLSRTSLAGANLEGANLEGANLEGADLTGARLVRATLIGARLARAKLRYANLLGAQVEPQALDGTDLWGACKPRPALAQPSSGRDLAQEGYRAPVSLALDADGRLLASGSRGGGIAVWDTSAGRPLRAWSGHASQVTALAFSPVGCALASAAQDSTVRLWDVTEGRPSCSLEGHRGSVLAVAFGPDGVTLASGSEDGTVRLWDTRSARPLAVLEGPPNAVLTVAFSPDGGTLASGAGDGPVRLWDARTGKLLRTLTSLESAARSVAFSPDGATIACGSHDRTVRLWDARSGELSMSLEGHRDAVVGVAFSPDGATLVSGSYDRTLRFWDARSGRLLRTIGTHDSPVLGVAFSPDRRTVVSAAYDETVRLWDVRTRELERSFKRRRTWILGAAFSPDGSTLATSSSDRTLRLWDARSGKLLHSCEGHRDWVHGVAFSPDGSTLATSSSDRTLRLWDARSGEPLRTLEGHQGIVLGVVFSPDGCTLASGSHDETFRLWDVRTGEQTLRVKAHVGSVRAIAFSADGTRLATGSDDRTVRFWDARTGDLLRSLDGHQQRVRCVAFSPDGAALASGSHDGTVRLWDARAFELLRVIEGPAGAVRSVVFSPDGSVLACGAQDMTIRLWDPASGVLLRSIDSEQDSIRCVAFSPDGSILASGSNDGTLRLWRVSDGACLAALVPAAQGWAAHTPDGRYKVSGDVADAFWHVVGLVRFEPGELTGLEDAFSVQKPIRLREDDPLY